MIKLSPSRRGPDTRQPNNLWQHAQKTQRAWVASRKLWARRFGRNAAFYRLCFPCAGPSTIFCQPDALGRKRRHKVSFVRQENSSPIRLSSPLFPFFANGTLFVWWDTSSGLTFGALSLRMAWGGYFWNVWGADGQFQFNGLWFQAGRRAGRWNESPSRSESE